MSDKKLNADEFEKLAAAKENWERFKVSMDELMRVVGGVSEFHAVPPVQEHDYDGTESCRHTPGNIK